MTRYIWFRLAMRFLGLCMLAIYLPSFLQMLYYMVLAVREMQNGAPVAATMLRFVIDAATIGAAVYLLRGAPALVRWCLRDVDTTCVRCGCSLTRVTGGVCPECALRLRDGASGSSVTPSPAIERAD